MTREQIRAAKKILTDAHFAVKRLEDLKDRLFHLEESALDRIPEDGFQAGHIIFLSDTREELSVLTDSLIKLVDEFEAHDFDQ